MSNRDFKEIENTSLRVWNRCALAFNLRDDKGPDAVDKYLAKFNEREKRQMMIMFEYIRAKGYEAVKREVMRGEHNG